MRVFSWIEFFFLIISKPYLLQEKNTRRLATAPFDVFPNCSSPRRFEEFSGIVTLMAPLSNINEDFIRKLIARLFGQFKSQSHFCNILPHQQRCTICSSHNCTPVLWVKCEKKVKNFNLKSFLGIQYYITCLK